jgi:hypothetical protein
MILLCLLVFCSVGKSQEIQPIAEYDWFICQCEHHDDGQHVEIAAAKTFKVFIGPGQMWGIDRPTTVRLVKQGFNEISTVCAAQFEYVDVKNKANVRIEFQGNNDVMFTGRDEQGRPLYALGKGWTSGRIALNTDRKIPNLANLATLSILTIHEFKHTIRIGHNDDITSVMHPWAAAKFFNINDVKTLQRRLGNPEKPWHPVERIVKGKQLRTAIERFNLANEAWKKRAADRNKFADQGEWDHVRRVQPDVINLLQLRDSRGQDVAKFHREWWEINKRWNTSGLHGVIKL